MFDLLLGLILVFLIAINIKYKMKRSIHAVIIVIIFIIMLTLVSSYSFYKQHSLSFWEYWDYKKQALDYSKEFDPSHTYEFLDIENQGCEFLVGCTIYVKLESTSSADKINVLFNKGRLVPIARPN